MARPDPKKLLAQMQNAQWSREQGAGYLSDRT